MNTLVVAAPRLRRDSRSHVREDGRAKTVYTTEAEAIDAAIRWSQAPYLCNQNPTHWHLTKGSR
jgi:hypothetical protein